MQNPETVRVVDASPENESGFKVINKDDLGPDDVLFDAPAEKPSRAKRTKE